MRKIAFILLLSFSFSAFAQHINFEEFTLENGLHVILHKDNTVPVVAVSVSYVVGSRNEDSSKVGYSHFFENVLYENSHKISNKEFFKVMHREDGKSSVKKSVDKTYFSEVFPSNKIEFALWLESGRMQKAIIDTVKLRANIDEFNAEVDRSNSIFDYRNILEDVSQRLYKDHPYKWMSFNSKEYISKEDIEDLIAFYNKFYTPNNAILTIAGDIDVEDAKTLVKKYFSGIEKGEYLSFNNLEVEGLKQSIVDTIEMKTYAKEKIAFAFQMPKIKDLSNLQVDFLEEIISDRLRELGLENTFNFDYKIFNIKGIDSGKLIVIIESEEDKLIELKGAFDKIVFELRSTLISQSDFEEFQNRIELNFVHKNSRMFDLAESLSDYWLYFKNTGLINSEISMYRNISREMLQKFAKEYLNPNKRIEIYYLNKYESKQIE